MRVVWNRGMLMVQMNIEDAMDLLEWLQKVGTLVPNSAVDRLRTRLSDSFPDWSKLLRKT